MPKRVDLGPLRDDIASLQDDAPSGERRREAAARRRGPSRAAVRRRRLLASLVVAAIGVAVWYFFLNARNTDFAGTWAGSQALLGSSTLVVKHDGDSFRIKGLKIGGQAPTDVHVDDGRLYASGSAGGREWTVKFEIQADGRQMWAYYDAGDGQPEQRLRLTRVTD